MNCFSLTFRKKILTNYKLQRYFFRKTLKYLTKKKNYRFFYYKNKRKIKRLNFKKYKVQKKLKKNGKYKLKFILKKRKRHYFLKKSKKIIKKYGTVPFFTKPKVTFGLKSLEVNTRVLGFTVPRPTKMKRFLKLTRRKHKKKKFIKIFFIKMLKRKTFSKILLNNFLKFKTLKKHYFNLFFSKCYFLIKYINYFKKIKNTKNIFIKLIKKKILTVKKIFSFLIKLFKIKKNFNEFLFELINLKNFSLFNLKLFLKEKIFKFKNSFKLNKLNKKNLIKNYNLLNSVNKVIFDKKNLEKKVLNSSTFFNLNNEKNIFFFQNYLKSKKSKILFKITKKIKFFKKFYFSKAFKKILDFRFINPIRKTFAQKRKESRKRYLKNQRRNKLFHFDRLILEDLKNVNFKFQNSRRKFNALNKLVRKFLKNLKKKKKKTNLNIKKKLLTFEKKKKKLIILSKRFIKSLKLYQNFRIKHLNKIKNLSYKKQDVLQLLKKKKKNIKKITKKYLQIRKRVKFMVNYLYLTRTDKRFLFSNKKITKKSIYLNFKKIKKRYYKKLFNLKENNPTVRKKKYNRTKYFNKLLIEKIVEPKKNLETNLFKLLKKNFLIVKNKALNKILNVKNNIDSNNVILENESLINYSKKLIFFNKLNFFFNFYFTKNFDKILKLRDLFENRVDRLKNNFFENTYLKFNHNIEFLLKKFLLTYKNRNLKEEKEEFGTNYTASETIFYKKQIYRNLENFKKEKHQIKMKTFYFGQNHLYLKAFFFEKKRKFIKILQKKKKAFYFPLVLNFAQQDAFTVNDFFLKKLRKKHYGKSIALAVKGEIKRNKEIFSGIKIRLKGRFSRKQRATYLNIKHGKTPFNNRSFELTYSQINVPIKFGTVSVKVQVGKAHLSEGLYFLSKNYLNYSNLNKKKFLTNN